MSAKRLSVVFFPGGGIVNASARTRLYAYLRLLDERGIRYHITSYTWHKYDSRATHARLSAREKIWLELLPLRTVFAICRARTVFFQKHEIVPWAARLAGFLGKRIIYDIDDAVYLQTPDRKAGLTPHQREHNEELKRRIEWILKRADLSIVSGDGLARYALQFTPKVKIFPSVVDSVVAEPSKPQGPPVIGWVGAPENQRYVRTLEPVLMRLQEMHPELVIWIITSQLMDPPPRFRYRFIPWSFEAEAENIPKFTVGIAPLADDEWCWAKMNFKALVYLSHAVPALVTPGGFPLEEFEEGRSILVARSEDDWLNILERTITNPTHRDALARAGMDVVRKRFTPEARIAEWIEAISGEQSPEP